MYYEISERLITNQSKMEVLDRREDKFKRTSEKVMRGNDLLEVEAIQATFGSVNRKDIKTVELKSLENGFLITEAVSYKLSLWFWIIFILLLFTYVMWLIPVGFYFHQKEIVKTGIEEVFLRIKNEFASNTINTENKTETDSFKKLEQLADLMERRSKLA